MKLSRFKTFLASLLLLTALLAGFSTASAADGKVWVNISSGVYHCPGTRYYGSTKKGVFQTQAEAERRGYRPAYGSKCFNSSSISSSVAASSFVPNSQPGNSKKSAANNSTTQVWVNTKSGVYHCPGSRYYGATKSGRYMSETDAENGGSRPAYGTRCN